MRLAVSNSTRAAATGKAALTAEARELEAYVRRNKLQAMVDRNLTAVRGLIGGSPAAAVPSSSVRPEEVVMQYTRALRCVSDMLALPGQEEDPDDTAGLRARELYLRACRARWNAFTYQRAGGDQWPHALALFQRCQELARDATSAYDGVTAVDFRAEASANSRELTALQAAARRDYCVALGKSLLASTSKTAKPLGAVTLPAKGKVRSNVGCCCWLLAAGCCTY